MTNSEITAALAGLSLSSDREAVYHALGYSQQQLTTAEELLEATIDSRSPARYGFTASSAFFRRRCGEERNDNLALYHCPLLNRSRVDVSQNIINDVLSGLVPDGNTLGVIFSDCPDSGVFDHLQEDTLYLFISPTQRLVENAPSADWEEITGGWKRGNRVYCKRGQLLRYSSDDAPARLTAARPDEQQQALAELLDGHWPQDYANFETRQAHELVHTCRQAALIFDRIKSMDTDSVAGNLRMTVEAANTSFTRTSNQLLNERNSRRTAQEQVDGHRQRLSEQNAGLEASRQIHFVGVKNLMQQVEEIAAIEQVEEAAVVFYSAATGNLPAAIKIKVRRERGQPVEMILGGDGPVVCSNRITLESLGLERRQVALSEKIARLEMVAATQMICRALA